VKAFTRTSDVGQIEIEAVLLEALLVLAYDVASGHLQPLPLLPEVDQHTRQTNHCMCVCVCVCVERK